MEFAETYDNPTVLRRFSQTYKISSMCWKCGNSIAQGTFISRTSECPVCGADLHSCKNCRFYSPGSYYDCRETVSELVRDKEKSNFCDNFTIKLVFSGISEKNGAAGKNGADAGQSARDAFNSLFGSLVCP
ncbi:hypothetical protein [Treponema parvum]|nr:hypothetical protein [Treponema parvum]